MKLTNHWKTLLKFCLVAAIFLFLSSRGFLTLSSLELAAQKPERLFPAILAVSLGIFLGAVRWNILLSAQNISLPYISALKLQWIGMFFNIALPGAVSGDVIKVLSVEKYAHAKKSKVVSSVIFDRIIGLSSLFISGIIGLVMMESSSANSAAIDALKLTLSLFALGATLFFSFLFFLPDRRDPIARTLRKLSPKARLFMHLLDVYESFRTFRSSPIAILQAVGLSVVLQSAGIWSYYQFSLILGAEHLAFADVLFIAPMGLLVSAIPLLPGGVGTGHAAFLSLFHMIGSERGADIFNMGILINVLLSLVGGLFYLRSPRTKSLPTV